MDEGSDVATFGKAITVVHDTTHVAAVVVTAGNVQ